LARIHSPDLALRVANALDSYAAYIAKTLYPVDLAVYYPFPTGGIPAWRIGIAVALLVGGSSLASVPPVAARPLVWLRLALVSRRPDPGHRSGEVNSQAMWTTTPTSR